MNISDNREQILKELGQHKTDVRNVMDSIIFYLRRNATVHDDSKCDTPEIEALTLIKDMKYGSKEYNDVCKSEGIQHHYKVNRHHPEHFDNGVDDMNLLDLMEYFVDCYCASNRRGGVSPDFNNQKERHGLSPQLIKILNNTVTHLNKDNGNSIF